MKQCLFGTETEYAITPLGGNRERDRSWALHGLVETARTTLVHAVDAESHGLFLGNGGRFYIDAGGHPEMSTPECTNPWDGVRYILAGNQIVADVAARLVETNPRVGEILISRCNVDYSGSQSTWGCHESYLTRTSTRNLSQQILPHLVSRLVFTGAGGFNNRARGLVFTLSPRVPHLTNTVSADTTRERGILNTKNEPLCNGYRRLHLICGESLCSQTAMWLKLGTTALVVALAEAGVQPGDAVRLARPVQAMQTFAGDPTCSARARSTEGAELSALDIQRHYLQLAERHARAEFMPAWTGEVCERWRAMLDRLDDAPDSVTTTLDWALKLDLFQRHARRRGLDWASIGHWSSIVEQIHHALGPRGLDAGPTTAERLTGVSSPTPLTVARTLPFLRRQGLSWDGLQLFLDVTRELFEIDTRFSQLGPRGIFAALEHAGALDHALLTPDEVTRATAEPPASGRARWRGEAIRALASNRTPARATWQAVWDDDGNRVLNLNNPFADAPIWGRGPSPGSIESRLERVRRRMAEAGLVTDTEF